MLAPACLASCALVAPTEGLSTHSTHAPARSTHNHRLPIHKLIVRERLLGAFSHSISAFVEGPEQPPLSWSLPTHNRPSRAPRATTDSLIYSRIDIASTTTTNAQHSMVRPRSPIPGLPGRVVALVLAVVVGLLLGEDHVQAAFVKPLGPAAVSAWSFFAFPLSLPLLIPLLFPVFPFSLSSVSPFPC